MSNLISIIVPVYNVQQYVGPCIESIIKQTYKNLEIIIINDGSVDGSLSVCEEYAEKDKRIKIISQKNGGLSAARNTGLDHARGEYIGFVDSDDRVSPVFVEVLFHLITTYHADISQCSYTKTENTHDEIRQKDFLPAISIYQQDEYIQKLYDARFYPSNIICWNKLYTKKLWEDVRFPSNLLHEDEYTIPEILLKAENIVVTTEPLYGYLQRSNSIMSSENLVKRYTDVLTTLKKRQQLFSERGLKELETMTKLKTAYFLYDLLMTDPQNQSALTQLRGSLSTVLRHPHASLRFKLCCLLIACSPTVYRRLFYRKKK